VSLIGQECSPCQAAAKADGGRGGGLAGRWWRAWANASDAIGYIGAGIVGGFVVVVSVWYLARYVLREVNKKRSRHVGLVA
jgi:high-affinity nickel-transport protein